MGDPSEVERDGCSIMNAITPKLQNLMREFVRNKAIHRDFGQRITRWRCPRHAFRKIAAKRNEEMRPHLVPVIRVRRDRSLGSRS
ncbi:hypothetical protein RRSWK_01670 [Rhodopirellula sp. SWK7]|nr:hypothetical protein RRSWK_01670 [Rhodopirellula sp. SWK7]